MNEDIKKRKARHNRKYYLKNRKKLIEEARQYRLNNKDTVRITKKKYYEKNKENILEMGKKERMENPEKFRLKSSDYRKINKDKCCATVKKSYNKKRNNLRYRLNRSIRTGIIKSLKANNNSKNGRHWETLVDYDVHQLKKHLTATMPIGYTWDDYINGKLHIDHIIPISAFNFSSSEHIDFKRCWALDNLQLLPAKENLVKSNKLEQSFQPSLAI